jgi:hypothetical protein
MSTRNLPRGKGRPTRKAGNLTAICEPIVLYRVEPLLCNDCDIGGYTRAVSGQQLSKHFPVTRQQILNNETVGLQE